MLSEWSVLGPFACGTREDPWLDAVSDIYNEPVDFQKSYRSSLCKEVVWKAIWPVKSSNSLLRDEEALQVQISFPDVDWTHLRSIYGWAALQFQAYVRGKFVLTRDCTIELTVHGSPEFLLDGHRFEGNIYSTPQSSNLLLDLEAGSHQLDIRAIYEIRVFGDTDLPTVGIAVSLGLPRGHDLGDNEQSRALLPPEHAFNVPGVRHRSDKLVGTHDPNLVSQHGSQSRYPLDLTSALDLLCSASVKLGEPRIIGYVDNSGSISQAIYRAPRHSNPSAPSNQVPVVLALHGAGVTYTSEFWWREFRLAYPTAWILLPDCGAWGDDYHALGALSIQQALLGLLVEHKRLVDLFPAAHLPKPDINALVVLGHSNGAQGAMQFVVRNSDRVIGAAWAAGYLSINRYVPYSQWTCNAAHAADKPEFDILRNIAHFRQVPCFIRHSADDDNVPIYHGRQVAAALGVELDEVPVGGHWYDGILTSGTFEAFVEQLLAHAHPWRPLPETFEVLSWGTPIEKFGMRITEVSEEFIPNVGARLVGKYCRETHTLTIRTVGVASFALYKTANVLFSTSQVYCLVVDGVVFDGAPLFPVLVATGGFVKGADGLWKAQTKAPRSVALRDLTRILESPGSIHVSGPELLCKRVMHSLAVYHQIKSSRNLPSRNGNKIILEIDSRLPHSTLTLTQNPITNKFDVLATLVIRAPTYEDLSKSIRLIPWRTGSATYGSMEVDWSTGQNLLLGGRLMPFEQPHCERCIGICSHADVQNLLA